MTGPIVSAEEARGLRNHVENTYYCGPIVVWGVQISDLAFTVEQQDQQIAAVLAVHRPLSLEGQAPWGCSSCESEFGWPCTTVRAVGVES